MTPTWPSASSGASQVACISNGNPYEIELCHVCDFQEWADLELPRITGIRWRFMAAMKTRAIVLKPQPAMLRDRATHTLEQLMTGSTANAGRSNWCQSSPHHLSDQRHDSWSDHAVDESSGSGGDPQAICLHSMLFDIRSATTRVRNSPSDPHSGLAIHHRSIADGDVDSFARPRRAGSGRCRIRLASNGCALAPACGAAWRCRPERPPGSRAFS